MAPEATDEESPIYDYKHTQTNIHTLITRTMKYNYNKNLVHNAQLLRKGMTPEEKHLWYDFLKKLPVTVNRQKNIGDYIVDFYISEKQVVIEIDGSQHGDPEHRQADIARDRDLMLLGITVLRYTNRDINCRFITVCEDILKHLRIEPSNLKT